MFGGSEFLRRAHFFAPFLLVLLWSRRRDDKEGDGGEEEREREEKRKRGLEQRMMGMTMISMEARCGEVLTKEVKRGEILGKETRCGEIPGKEMKEMLSEEMKCCGMSDGPTKCVEMGEEAVCRMTEMEGECDMAEDGGSRESGGEGGVVLGGGVEALDASRKQRFGSHRWVANSGSLMVMEDSCKLPDHLIESVLARLPLQSLFRFRVVCRSWNSLLYSPTFLKAYSEAAIRHDIWFFVVKANLGRMGGRFGRRVAGTYDPERDNWHRIPLPSPLRDLNPQPTAADGGLVCYFAYENRLRTLFVCNPLTKTLRKLPQVMKNSSHISVLKMVMDGATGTYKVFVLGLVPGENDDDNWSMEMYDSASDCWSSSGIIPARYPKRRPVYGNGVLYVKCYDQRSLLLTLDPNVGSWGRVHAPLPHNISYEELVEYQGQILLLGVLEESYKIENVCIWEFQHSGSEWKLVDTMPQDLFTEFFCDPGYFECRDDERVLMKCCKYYDLILCVAFNISDRGPFKAVAYDLSLRRWRRLPESFQGHRCKTHKFIEGIPYEPRLDVVA